MSPSKLSEIRTAEYRSESSARFAYHAVVSTYVWPSSRPIMGSDSPSAGALADDLPGIVEVAHRLAPKFARDHEGVAVHARDRLQYGRRLRRSEIVRGPVFVSGTRSSFALRST